uniref:MHC class I antigen n=1 Tax=Rodentolepis nana TaxID=102285 RepID=A0A0R3THK2_RODNA
LHCNGSRTTPDLLLIIDPGSGHKPVIASYHRQQKHDKESANAVQKHEMESAN